MSIGYACQLIGVPYTNLRTCMVKNADEENLCRIIDGNLEALSNMMDYNKRNRIQLFRISSDIIPFGSSPVNSVQWWEIFAERLYGIGKMAQDANIRLSMHPGQYTVLNSTNPDVVERAKLDLQYHSRFLDSLGCGPECKIILHVGGVYGNKEDAKYRFTEQYHQLPESVQKRLILENDEKLFHIEDVMQIAEQIKVPVVFDTLHHELNKAPSEKDQYEWIETCRATWQKEDGIQKIHYSQQNPKKKSGSHSETIELEQFSRFFRTLKRRDIDIMLEVKDKNLSAVKCCNLITDKPEIRLLEQEWGKYKYDVLEKSQQNYNAIRQILKEKAEYPIIPFYQLIDEAARQTPDVGSSVNAALHIWGYFKYQVTQDEKKEFLRRLARFQKTGKSLGGLKKLLWKYTERYGQGYLMESYYFADAMKQGNQGSQ